MVKLSIISLIAAIAAGCQTSCPTTTKPYEGQAVFIRGFGNFASGGLRSTAECLSQAGLEAYDWQCGEIDSAEFSAVMGDIHHRPIILGGHSLGADQVIEVAWRLASRGITVDLLVLIDPFCPASIPRNVKAVHLYQARPATIVVAEPFIHPDANIKWPNGPVIAIFDRRPVKIPMVDTLVGLVTHFFSDDDRTIAVNILNYLSISK